MKLEWQENPSKELMSWKEANQYAKSLGGSWRLPTIKELKKAYDNKVQGFKPEYYWSSSTYTNSAWGVNFLYGGVYYSYKTLNYYVRCVREI